MIKKLLAILSILASWSAQIQAQNCAICKESFTVEFYSDEVYQLRPNLVADSNPILCEGMSLTITYPDSATEARLGPDRMDASLFGITLPVTVKAADGRTCPSQVTAHEKEIIQCPGDTIQPVAICSETVIVRHGQNFVTAAHIDDGSYDNCSDIDYFINRIQEGFSKPSEADTLYFDRNGRYSVVLWAVDQEGNYSPCVSTVIVENLSATACQNDTIAPTPLCFTTRVFQNTRTIQAVDLDAGSFDNCSEVTLYIGDAQSNSIPEATSLSFAASGLYPVSIWAVDQAGNSDFCETLVKIVDSSDCDHDQENPVLVTQPRYEVYFGNDSSTVIGWQDLVIEANDNCDISAFGISLASDQLTQPSPSSEIVLALSLGDSVDVVVWLTDQNGNFTGSRSTLILHPQAFPLTCYPETIVSVDLTTSVKIFPGQLLAALPHRDYPIQISLNYPLGTDTTLFPNLVNYSLIGSTLSARVSAFGESCTSNVTIEGPFDDSLPVVFTDGVVGEVTAGDIIGNEAKDYCDEIMDSLCAIRLCPEWIDLDSTDVDSIDWAHYFEPSNWSGPCENYKLVGLSTNYDLNDCGVGSIEIMYAGVDTCGHFDTVWVAANIFPRSDFEAIFPADTLVSILDYENGPVWEQPQIWDAEVETLGIQYTDEIFQEGSQMIVYRTWQIIDWCVYDPISIHLSSDVDLVVDSNYLSAPNRPCGYRYLKDDGNGWMQYTQIITVSDPEEIIFEVMGFDQSIINCETVRIEPIIDCQQGDCSRLIPNWYNSEGQLISSLTGMITASPGQYLFTLTDESTQYEFAFELSNTALPDCSGGSNIVKSQSRLRPNPTRGTTSIDIEMTESDWVTIEVLHVSGNRIVNSRQWTSNGDRISLDISDQPSGFYYVLLHSSQGTSSHRLMKID